ncbi:hypothetical protein V8G61_12790 [Gaetbulibacter sp. M240]|uniref:hypothetical protein n=1 Tax=Gaetbulibacter sp. M240 TaxID=3126511 RepID=UPI00374F0E7E
MLKILLKSGLYAVLILLCLEAFIRVFHLTKDYPSRYVDKYGVEKWVPNQNGYSVTGIRRQNFSEYHINNFGYNSYREFKPTYNTQEIALVGDSFIEGFHQNYSNSIGKKIENQLDNVQVFEFGYAGYDLADQLHLIDVYKDIFDKIDRVYVGLSFEDDLTRREYSVLEERMKLESPLYKTLRKSKLIVYLSDIGTLSAVTSLMSELLSLQKRLIPENSQKKAINNIDLIEKRLSNFKSLVSLYGFDKKRFVLFLDVERTPEEFIMYLQTHNFQYLDFGSALERSEEPTTLIYDMHWNDHGRNIIADLIVTEYETHLE